MIKKLIYLKLCWNRALSHINIPLSIINHGMMFAVFLKVFNLYNWKILSLFMIVLCGSLIVIGHYDLKLRIYDIETSMNNEFNPELKTLLKNRDDTNENK